MNRRRFTALVLAAAPTVRAAAPPSAPIEAGRTLDLVIGEGFHASDADVRAVLVSAANEIWRHCPNSRWKTPGFSIFHTTDCPINSFDHREDGRIAIGLTSSGTYWSQYAYQFAHEFCHALAGHANDWRATWIRERKANHWLEESICETASLFALKGMGKTWQTAPPYPNWKDYAGALNQYADDRLAASAAAVPEGNSFLEWLRENEPTLRENGTLRDKNNRVARQILPLFEAHPGGWEALTAFNLTKNRKADKSLREHFTDWIAAAPPVQRDFIRKLAAEFGVS